MSRDQFNGPRDIRVRSPEDIEAQCVWSTRITRSARCDGVRVWFFFSRVHDRETNGNAIRTFGVRNAQINTVKSYANIMVT